MNSRRARIYVTIVTLSAADENLIGGVQIAAGSLGDVLFVFCISCCMKHTELMYKLHFLKTVVRMSRHNIDNNRN